MPCLKSTSVSSILLLTVGVLSTSPLQALGLESPVAPIQTIKRPESLSPAWAVLLLRSIAERYGCGSSELGGSHPVQINRVLNRGQAALELDACETKMNDLINTSSNDEIVPLEDIHIMFKLKEEFMPELNEIRVGLNSAE
jgi:hypothetical protein